MGQMGPKGVADWASHALRHPRVSLSLPWPPARSLGGGVMTHKYRGCIVVLSINKSVEPNEEQ
jgi:hypothetical protein